MKINTKDLRIAQVRYFDTMHNGVEVPLMEAYAFLLKTENCYVNILDPEKDYPVYDRVPYSNTTRDGIDFGTKIILVSGECEDGLCYVIEKVSVKDILKVEEVTRKELEIMAEKSKLFFIDLFDIHKAQKKTIFNGQFREEQKKMKEFQKYLDFCEKGLQYHK